MIVYLVGYMASGKTYTGPRLAEALGWYFIDLDQMIEAHYKIGIRDFFDKYGEAHFREAERRMLHSTFSLSQTVVSTGGGTACFYDNMEWMNLHGITVYLKQDPETLFRRLLTSRKPRPLARDHNPNLLRGQIDTHLKQRIAFYEKASIIVDASVVDIEKLVSLVRFSLDRS